MRLAQGEKLLDELSVSGDINVSLLMCLLADIPNM